MVIICSSRFGRIMNHSSFAHYAHACRHSPHGTHDRCVVGHVLHWHWTLALPAVSLRKVLQKPRKGGSTITIGKKGEWPTTLWEDGRQRQDYSSLKMGGGDHCFASKGPRRAEIHFECAPKPALLAVQEAQVCVYAFRMATPAACHPLHHAD
ncbi:unnamed protein product [Prorocentrum cordatum]|uniref:MRH domain-containing protein n=1 Tax=Prorocentrum cordatum TaxID=2364126 RepID=A0ABN9S2M7_9DINO|nr:unnamed protein product [Polarella glacialis]